MKIGRVAACVAMVCAGISGVAQAQSLSLQRFPIYGDTPATEPVMAPTTAPTPDKPLAGVLKGAHIDTGPFNIYGFVEGSYTYDASHPPGNFITGRVYDIDNEEIILNQIDLAIEKVVDPAAVAKSGQFDLGGKIEIVYGNDARFIHSNGLNFYGGDSPQAHPENQFDLVQAYVDFGIPVGSGLVVRAGKFVTLLGEEVINPTGNMLYSHSYLFGYAIPFTNTGVLGMYSVNDKMTLTGGITRGWDEATKDNNDVIDYTGQVKYVFNDKVTGYVNFITGPEQFDDNSDYRTVLDGIVSYQATDKLSFAVNGDYGWEPGASATGNAASWYGVAAYAGIKLCDAASINTRVEWFNDDDDARGIGDTVYEGTIGLSLKPMPNSDIGSNLLIRPEVRMDYSDHGVFDGGTDHYQFTAAIDAIFTF